MIYVITHKKFDLPNLCGHIPLHVGAYKGDEFGYLKDNTGNNISEKNPYFCELTGLYWIWKNCTDEYKGLVHYRRYFTQKGIICPFSRILPYHDLRFLLDYTPADIILPRLTVLNCSVKDQMIEGCSTQKIFHQLEKCVQNLFPEYMQSFTLLFDNNSAYFCNMMFCKREIFDSYCEWLFAILFELEKHISLEELDDSRKRQYGFLSERLLNVWILHNKLRVKELRILNIEETNRKVLVFKDNVYVK